VAAAFASVLVTRSWEQVAEQIRERIRDGTLGPGQRLPTERELGESFGVSRPVVREALKVLSATGWVETRQGSGTFVTADPKPALTRAFTLRAAPDDPSVLGLYELREPLDALAARLASHRRDSIQAADLLVRAGEAASAADAEDWVAFGVADDRFHDLLCEIAGNPYLTEVLGSVRHLLRDVAALVVRLSGSMHVAAEQHRRIAEAVAGGDASSAAAAMAEHVRYSADALRSVLASRTTAGVEAGVGPGMGFGRADP
jgi:DNA-binding FadR family transcriptional regulator